jgi:polynucleotide 5'-kinase involved in rRNA processing
VLSAPKHWQHLCNYFREQDVQLDGLEAMSERTCERVARQFADARPDVGAVLLVRAVCARLSKPILPFFEKGRRRRRDKPACKQKTKRRKNVWRGDHDDIDAAVDDDDDHDDPIDEAMRRSMMAKPLWDIEGLYQMIDDSDSFASSSSSSFSSSSSASPSCSAFDWIRRPVGFDLAMGDACRHWRTALVCGATGTGKSTLARMLINRAWSAHGSVLVLDTDVGQCEFTSSGMVSLVLVERPLIGPPWTHLAGAAGAGVTLIKAHYVGNKSPNKSPVHYEQCIMDLVRCYWQELGGADAMPLVANTHGWVSGVGFDMLARLTLALRADVVVHLLRSESARATEHDRLVTSSLQTLWAGAEPRYAPNYAVLLSAARVSSRSASSSKGALASSEARELQTRVYFETLGTRCVGPLCAQLPYAVSLRRVGVAMLFEEVASERPLLDALNGVIVGLLVVSGESIDDSAVRSLRLRGEPLMPSADSRCLGLGVVRSVDPSRQLLYIVTPVEPKLLAQCNLLARGIDTIPLSMMSFVDRSSSSSSLVNTPYQTSLLASSADVIDRRPSTRHRVARKQHQYQ